MPADATAARPSSNDIWLRR